MKEQFLERFPNLIIADAVGSTETGYNGVRVIVKGGQRSPGMPTVRMGPDTVVLDDDMNIVAARFGRRRAHGARRQRAVALPQGSGEVGGDVRRRRRPAVSPSPATSRIVEEDGTMTLLGRGSVCINSGGEKIYPEEVEAALKAHPGGVRRGRRRRSRRALGRTRRRRRRAAAGTASTLEELDAHCREHVAGYKVPRELHVVDKIERSPSGKPDYPWAKKVALGTSS